jgi:hypothetical protein
VRAREREKVKARGRLAKDRGKEEKDERAQQEARGRARWCWAADRRQAATDSERRGGRETSSSSGGGGGSAMISSAAAGKRRLAGHSMDAGHALAGGSESERVQHLTSCAAFLLAGLQPHRAAQRPGTAAHTAALACQLSRRAAWRSAGERLSGAGRARCGERGVQTPRSSAAAALAPQRTPHAASSAAAARTSDMARRSDACASAAQAHRGSASAAFRRLFRCDAHLPRLASLQRSLSAAAGRPLAAGRGGSWARSSSHVLAAAACPRAALAAARRTQRPLPRFLRVPLLGHGRCHGSAEPPASGQARGASRADR